MRRRSRCTSDRHDLRSPRLRNTCWLRATSFFDASPVLIGHRATSPFDIRHRASRPLSIAVRRHAAVRRRVRRYDVIVDCENGIPFFTPLFVEFSKVLLVHHVHREIFRRETHPPIRWLGYWLEGSLMPKVYKKTPIVAVSASTRDDLVGLGFKAEQIHIVHNGVLEVTPWIASRRQRRESCAPDA